MTKKLLSVGVAFLLLTVCTSMSSAGVAGLETIGTGTLDYGFGTVGEFNLLWNAEQDLVWLDYTKSAANWSTVYVWAGGLDRTLTLNMSENYNVTWGDAEWRLPNKGETVLESELGHLFYNGLGFVKTYDENNSFIPFTDEVLNSKDFDNFRGISAYWADNGTSSGTAQVFTMKYGGISSTSKINHMQGIAVRDVVQVTRVSTVPVPGTLWLLGVGLLGLTGITRKQTL